MEHGIIQLCAYNQRRTFEPLSNVVLQPVGTGLDVFEGRPKLSAWRDRVKKEIGVKLFDEAHEMIMNIASISQKLQGDKLEMLKPKFQKFFI